MAGTKEGAAKAKAKLLEQNPNYYEEIGARGGKKSHPNKGFGSMSPEERSAAGRKGGTKSKRGKSTNKDEESQS